MNLYLRLLLVVLGALRRPRIAPLTESVVHFRVLPNDLDFWGHMNNGRYCTVTDLGRLDYFMRTGFVGIVHREGWTLPIGSLTMRFRRPLLLFQRYALQTRLAGWDEKWFYIESRFVRGEELVARGLVKGLVRHGRETVSPGEVMERMGASTTSPELSPELRAWARAEHDLLGRGAGR